MKTVFSIIGAFLLIIVFFVVYNVVLTLRPHSTLLEGFTNQPMTVGQTGGFHILSDIRVIQHDKYDSIVIYTKLNRSSAAEDILTPFTEATPAGTISIRIKLFDTSILSDLSQTDLDRVTHQTVADSIIQDIALTNPQSLDSQEVTIRLARASRYRLSADSQDAGIIYLDVLK